MKKETFKELYKRGVMFEIHTINKDKNMFGLRWGEGKVATILGFKRKDVISALEWADENGQEALKILGF